MEARVVYEQNPWWAEPSLIRTDRLLQRLETAPFQWIPSVRSRTDLETDFAVYVLRGPRQVGKTTLLKGLVKDLLKAGKAPRSIFYLSLDMARSFSEVVDAIDLARQNSAGELRYVFLDEITFLPEWQRAIKYSVDSGKLDHCLVILTGSSAWDLRRGAERLPGRRGQGTDLELRPMSFAEFARAVHRLDLPESPFDSLMESPSRILGQMPLLSQVEAAFLNYLKCGGFPLAVLDYAGNSQVSEATFAAHEAAMLGEVQKWRKDTHTVKTLLSTFTDSLTTPVSWENLSNTTRTAQTTVREYVDFLRDSYIVEYLQAVDVSTLTGRPKKRKKHYLQDPLVLRVCSRWSGREKRLWETSEDCGKLVENVVAEHLCRTGYETFYFHSERGREVDFVVVRDKTPYPIEVKYQTRANGWDELSLKKSFGRGLILTRDSARAAEIPHVPAALFLACLKV